MLILRWFGDWGLDLDLDSLLILVFALMRIKGWMLDLDVDLGLELALICDLGLDSDLDSGF